MLFKAIAKAHNERDYTVEVIKEILSACGYELVTKRVLGYSGNMHIEKAMHEYRDLKRRGLTEKEIDGEMQLDRQFDEGEEEYEFHDIIDGEEFFDAAFTAVRNSTIQFTVRKVGDKQDFPRAMRLLGSGSELRPQEVDPVLYHVVTHEEGNVERAKDLIAGRRFLSDCPAVAGHPDEKTISDAANSDDDAP